MAKPPTRPGPLLRLVTNVWNSLAKGRTIDQQARVIGEDVFGNKYFEIPADPSRGKRRSRRWYTNASSGHHDVRDGSISEGFDSEIPSEWESWLRHRRDAPPSDEQIYHSYAIADMKKVLLERTVFGRPTNCTLIKRFDFRETLHHSREKELRNSSQRDVMWEHHNHWITRRISFQNTRSMKFCQARTRMREKEGGRTIKIHTCLRKKTQSPRRKNRDSTSIFPLRSVLTSTSNQLITISAERPPES